MYDVIKRYDKVAEEVVKGFEKVGESASVNECLAVNGALNHDFRPVWPGIRAVGRAFTVTCRAGDNLILQKAITMLKPLDFLMISCDGFQESGGMWGGLMSNAAMTMGAVGMVIDGCVRDSMMMKEIGWSCWSRGISVKRSTKVTPGKINHSIVMGNIAIHPGDLVFADNDGVVVVPRLEAPAVLERVLEREAAEEVSLSHLRQDGTYNFYRYKFNEMYEKLGLTEEPD